MHRFVVLFTFAVTGCTTAQIEQATPKTDPPGKHIAFARDKGNCLACHEIEDGEFPGNIGPPLKDLAQRFKTKQTLRAQIWDATKLNPQTSMPPFGRNRILTDSEIDQVVDYLWTLH